MKCALVFTNVWPWALAINLNVHVLMPFRCGWDVMFSILSISCTSAASRRMDGAHKLPDGIYGFSQNGKLYLCLGARYRSLERDLLPATTFFNLPFWTFIVDTTPILSSILVGEDNGCDKDSYWTFGTNLSWQYYTTKTAEKTVKFLLLLSRTTFLNLTNYSFTFPDLMVIQLGSSAADQEI